MAIDWQPIDTAPKDGRQILAWCAGNFGHQIVSWDNEDGEWRSESRVFHPSWPPLFWAELTEPNEKSPPAG